MTFSFSPVVIVIVLTFTEHRKIIDSFPMEVDFEKPLIESRKKKISLIDFANTRNLSFLIISSSREIQIHVNGY